MIHRLAILLLLVVAAMSVVGSFSHVPGTVPALGLAPFFGIVIWSWLLWKIWKHPHRWGLGVGIFLFLMIAFQIYLWRIAVTNPRYDKLDVERSTARFILIYELPIFIAGVSCIALRFRRPSVATGDRAKAV